MKEKEIWTKLLLLFIIISYSSSILPRHQPKFLDAMIRICALYISYCRLREGKTFNLCRLLFWYSHTYGVVVVCCCCFIFQFFSKRKKKKKEYWSSLWSQHDKWIHNQVAGKRKVRLSCIRCNCSLSITMTVGKLFWKIKHFNSISEGADVGHLDAGVDRSSSTTAERRFLFLLLFGSFASKFEFAFVAVYNDEELSSILKILDTLRLRTQNNVRCDECRYIDPK